MLGSRAERFAAFAGLLATQGNLLRRSEAFWESRQLHKKALQYLQASSAPPSIVVSVLSLRASLLTDLAEYEEAEACLRYALELAGGEMRPRVLWGLANVARYLGHPDRAIPYFRGALLGLDATQRPAAQVSLALALAEAGKPDEARSAIPSLVQSTDHQSAVCTWVRGLIAAQLNEDGAIEYLEAAAAAFGLLSDVQGVALVSLDLAEQHLALGRLEKVRSLAQRAYALLKQLGVPTEALGALLAIQEAEAASQLRSLRRGLPLALALGRKSRPH